MPVCPNCHTEHTKRKGGACPRCFIPMLLVDGKWIPNTDESPNKIILKTFESLVSEQQNCLFNIPPKGLTYRIELKAAGQLYTQATEDIQLTLAALTLLFTDSRFNWKTRTTLLTVSKDFNLTLAITRKIFEQRRRQEMLERETAKRVSEREEIFS